jgi:hypothetical protein
VNGNVCLMKLGYGEDEKSFDMEKVRKFQVQQHFLSAARHDFFRGSLKGLKSISLKKEFLIICLFASCMLSAKW